jgi:mono/diheme cytochrome c family protein
MKKRLQELLWPILGLAVGLLVFGAQPQVHALPEYATRTGEPCTTCHVNPAGGGPRTARGALWIAQGRPDIVPQLPGSTAAESPASGDGPALYAQLGCAGCHGAGGEGASGPALNVPGASQGADRVIRSGRGTMVGYKVDRLSDADLAAVLQFVQSLASDKGKGSTDAGPQPLDPAAFVCASAPPGASTIQSCGGN